jgi:BolA family transcriptional regulator, general stress-responsive regulator
LNEQRVENIRARLHDALSPEMLEVEDESHLHVGHAGARDGRGHFRLTIVSQAFRGASPVRRHRLVYEALGDLMETDIHALAIQALAPEDV